MRQKAWKPHRNARDVGFSHVNEPHKHQEHGRIRKRKRWGHEIVEEKRPEGIQYIPVFRSCVFLTIFLTVWRAGTFS